MKEDKYYCDLDIHRESYSYYKKSEIELAFKNLAEGKNATLRIYNAENNEIIFEKEYTSERYFRRFKNVIWIDFEELKENVEAALEMRKQLEKGDFN